MVVKQVLIIDDEPDLRKLIQTCLELIEGWQVITASSGPEGLAQAEAKQPDLILLDLMMPQIDGLGTLEKLRANALTQQIPVILLTAKSRSIDQEHLTHLNIQGIISKPFNPMKLTEQIKAILGKIKVSAPDK